MKREDKVRREFEKNPNMKLSDIQCIQDWLMSQPHLPIHHISDFDIILAYHCCDRDIEVTKKVIDRNFTLRTLFSFYQNRRLDDSLRNALNTWSISPMEATTSKGYRAIYCQLMDADPAKFVYADVVRAFVMIIDLWLHEEGTAPGTVLILNMNNVSSGHLSRIDLTVAQEFFYFLQEAMFVRLKEFHFMNAPSFMDTLLSMLKPFMKKELLDMVRVHQTDSSSLEDCIPKDALPLCGEKNKTWKELIANESFFDEESLKRVDESKRPGGPKSMSDFFSGMVSSFKKLEID